VTAHPLAPPERRWGCPNCTATKVTHTPGNHTPLHECSGLRGLAAPFVEDGDDAEVIAVAREDYLNGAVQTTDANGTPVMSILRRHADGRVDCWAQAPLIRITTHNG
jgi:hypothetical protein